MKRFMIAALMLLAFGFTGFAEEFSYSYDNAGIY